MTSDNDSDGILAIITARGGSKGLPRKNIRPLMGKPLLSWTIQAALEAKSLDSVIISTDDEEIAAIASAAGVRVPFIRPSVLANDTAKDIDVLLHALDTLKSIGEKYKIVVMLQPTSPLRESIDIDQSLGLLHESGAGSVVSVCRAECHHPAFMYRVANNSRLVPLSSWGLSDLRRQDLDPVYFVEGTVYASKIDVLRAQQSFYHEATVAYEVPKWKSLEIDDIYDFVMAEALMNYRKRSI